MPEEKRIYTVPLRKKWLKASTKHRVNRAVNALKSFVKKHTRADEAKISPALNEYLWLRGAKNPPGKVKIKVETEEGIATARLPEEVEVKEVLKKAEEKLGKEKVEEVEEKVKKQIKKEEKGKTKKEKPKMEKGKKTEKEEKSKGEKEKKKSEKPKEKSGKKEFKCPECGDTFDSKRGLKIHQGQKHKKSKSGKSKKKKSKNKK